MAMVRTEHDCIQAHSSAAEAELLTRPDSRRGGP